MNTLIFEYPKMVEFTPPAPGSEPAQVNTITILAATDHRFGAEGVWVKTADGETTVPLGFVSFQQSPFVGRAR